VKYFADWSFTTAQIAFYSCTFWFYNCTFCHNCTLKICPANAL